MKSKVVLIADDDKSILWLLERFFSDKGFTVLNAGEGLEAEALLGSQKPHIALIDINMPGKDGLQILRDAQAAASETSFIIMTAESTMDNTVEAMKLGAFDYISKPFDLNELEIIIERALGDLSMRKKLKRLSTRLDETIAEATVFVGKSRAVQEVFKTVGRLAASSVDVMVLGESGTGKELMARILHASSPRKDGPFVAVNAASVPTGLMESELFGHEKGAFTGAVEARPGKFGLADGGTIFLDEVGDMSLDLQARLLRVIQEREFYRVGGSAPVKVDVRIIAATNHDMEAMVHEKTFREDLWFRLGGITITMPPLRKRRSDIERLAEYFLEKFCAEFRCGPRTLSPGALEALRHYRWPGNVRELENVIRRAVLLSSTVEILPCDLNITAGERRGDSLENIIATRLKPFVEKTDMKGRQDIYDLIMPFMERPLLRLVLERAGGNQLRAAEVLGINRNTLRKKIRLLGIDKKGGKG
ncbi:MAG: sigma-54-dependent transcriptional regulator [Thermodesulfobacteriota bacterium]